MRNLFISLALMLLPIGQGAIAKSPPPGTGFQDVPTNVLIMLDTSGSMAWSALSDTIDYPWDIAFDSAGNRYIGRYYSEVMKYNADGDYVTEWGGYDSGGLSNGRFRYIYGIDIDSNDRIYVSDHYRGRVQIFDTDGNYISQFNVSTSASLGLAIDDSDNIYVINGNGDVEKYNTSGTRLDTWGGVNGAYMIATDNAGYVYVTKYYSQRVYKYDSNGNPVNSFGGNNYFSTSYNPFGIEIDDSGNIYVGDFGANNQIYQYNASGVLQNTVGGYGSGTTKFASPRGIAMDNDSNIWVADFYNDRIKTVDGAAILPENSGTRIEQAKQVVKDIVSNSTLTDGAHFGLMQWNSSASMVVDVSDAGAAEIFTAVDGLSAGGGTFLDSAMNLAESYFTNNGTTPMINGAWCQNNLLIVISDGEWVDNSASATAEALYDTYGIKTFVVGFTVSSSGTGAANYVTIAQRGGTYPDAPVFADNWQVLYESVSNYILQVINSNLTFSAPTIMPEVNATDYILQATFRHKTDHQWKGHLNKYALASDGSIGALEWDAGQVLATTPAANRDIWTVGDGVDALDYNNFTTTNLDALRVPLLENSGSSLDDNALEELINFVRGVDTYNEFSGGVDDDGDTIIDGERWKLADVYHSRAVIVGQPTAYFSDSVNDKTEAYYRSINDYATFKADNVSRETVVYVGSNGGMLHAFSSSNGAEKWAFIPPSIIPNFKDMISNTAGESQGIFGVDGSPTLKEIYYDGQWRTVLMSGARQGGHTYFALDVTNPDAPKHMFTFAHNTLTDTVSYWDASGNRTDYTNSATIPAEFDFFELGESWSRPLMLLLPVGDSGALVWTAVFGGGFNSGVNSSYGASLYIVNLEDGGKIINKITVNDNQSNNVATAVPPEVTAITPDSSTFLQGASMPYGATVYFNDLEGIMWKVNLTSAGTLYDTAQLFNAQTTGAGDNVRRAFHRLAATIDYDGNLYSYYGTGDMQSLGELNSYVLNRIFGITDDDTMSSYPTSTATAVQDLTNVTGGGCPANDKIGWYFNLDPFEKVTAPATIYNSTVLFPRYKPNSNDVCSAGTSSISEHGFICGDEQRETDLGYGVPTQAIVFKNKIYIGISTDQTNVTLPSGFTKQGNLIVGNPVNPSTGEVEVESWWESFF